MIQDRTQGRIRSVILVCAALAVGNLQCFAPPSRAAEQQNVFPGLEQQVERVRFHTGRVVNNQPEISPVLPDIPGPESRWTLLQWAQAVVISASQMKVNDPQTSDARLGIAAYAFTASDGHSHLWIYIDPVSHKPVYELY